MLVFQAGVGSTHDCDGRVYRCWPREDSTRDQSCIAEREPSALWPQLTETPRSRPMTAVTTIAKPPPIVTRNAARPSGAPPK